jgi:hypothetical protein
MTCRSASRATIQFSPMILQCTSWKPKENSPGFSCLLCVREGLPYRKFNHTKRWHDAPLPTSANLGEETAVWARENDSKRKVESAYLDQRGFIILPRIHYMIAMVRALEVKKEESVKSSITAAVGTYYDVGKATQEYLELFLVFHHEFNLLDIRVLAVLAIFVAVDDRGKTNIDEQPFMEAFSASQELYNSVDLSKALSNFAMWDATVSLHEIICKLPDPVRFSRQILEDQQEAICMLDHIAEADIFSKIVFRQQRARIMAFCAAYALNLSKLIKFKHEDVMESIGVELDKSISEMVRYTIVDYMDAKREEARQAAQAPQDLRSSDARLEHRSEDLSFAANISRPRYAKKHRQSEEGM